ncbi:MAG TPA: hypothetical protein VGO79_01985, partial [Thermoanaerobaculia bacterium]
AGFAEPLLAPLGFTSVARPPAKAPTPYPAGPQQAPLQIDHDPLACMTTVEAPILEAQVRPGPDVSKSYVYWRAGGTPYFYYTVMEGPLPPVKGVIPRPLPETKTVDYYLLAMNRASLAKKTPDYAPPVVESNSCKDKGLPVGAGGAGLTIGLTDEKQPIVPPGFNRADIAKVILLSGATVTLAAALASAGGGSAGAGTTSSGAGTGSSSGAAAGAGAAGATGAAAAGGISSTALIVGGVAVAAGVGIGVGVSQSGGGNKTATPVPPTATPRPPTPTPVVNRFIDVEATWSGLGDVDVQVLDPNGQAVGQVVPVGCDSTASRTERVVVQGDIASGTYQVRLTGKSCGDGSPAQITTLLTVLTETGPKCQGVFVNVPVGQTVNGCSF